MPGKHKINSKKENWFTRIKNRLSRKVEKLLTSFGVHSTVFVAVNVFLFVLNMTIAAPDYPWFYYALGGWAIGFFSHLQHLLNRRREYKQLRGIEKISQEQYKLLHRYQRKISNFRNHLTVYLSVNLYLFGINLLTTGFLFFLIVLGGWGIGMVSHLAAFLPSKKLLKKRLMESGINIEKLTVKAIAPPSFAGRYQNTYEEALAIKEALLKELKENREVKAQWGELEPLLNKYIHQIQELMHKDTELNNTLAAFSLEEIESRIKELQEKSTKTESPFLKNEYQKSITQQEKHRKSLMELLNHKEVINLRLNSSLVLLKQLKLDTVRIKNISNFQEPFSLRELRNKTEELSQYLEDFQEGMNHLEL